MTTWNVQEALDNLAFQNAMLDTPSPMALAKKMFEENLPIAVMSICNLAVNSENDGVRLNAAKYVVDRTLGETSKLPDTPEGKSPWEQIYEHVLMEADSIVYDSSNQ